MKLYQKIAATGLLALGLAGLVSGQDGKLPATQPSNIQPVQGYSTVAMGDIDNDGHPEMFVTGLDGRLSVFSYNASALRFVECNHVLSRAIYAKSVSLALIDNDAYLDMVVVGLDGRLSVFFYNASAPRFVEDNSVLPSSLQPKN